MIKMSKNTFKQVQALIKAGSVMIIGLIFFKLIPMQLFGDDITFDASAHITIAMLVLYFIWFWIDQNKSWRIPFFIFALVVLSIISIQRILMNAHDDFGLLAGFLLSLISIGYAQAKHFKNKFKF